MVGNVTGVFTIETLLNGDDPFSRTWSMVASLDTPEWGGSPFNVLLSWCLENDADPGTYRCTSPTRRVAEMSWTGDDE
jgi:hypothetical protein